MTVDLEFGLSKEEETQRLGAILSQCFNSPMSDWLLYLNRIGIENFRVVRQGGEIAGGLGIYQMGQWFGGRCVLMAGLAAVAVLPEYRGTGVAVELLARTLKELHAMEIPISVLYPATQRVYRKVGYEQGGTAGIFELRLDAIGVQMKETSAQEIRAALPMQSVNPVRHEVFHDLYHQWAIANNGNLERNQAIWERIVRAGEQELLYAYRIGSEIQSEGYIIFTQDAKESQILIRDWVALTPAAGRRLWIFLADHRSQIEKVVWQGGVVNPFLLLLTNKSGSVRGATQAPSFRYGVSRTPHINKMSNANRS